MSGRERMEREDEMDYEKVLGHRVIMGTEHPVYARVYKYGRTWSAAVVCNQIAEKVTSHKDASHRDSKGKYIPDC